MTLWSNLLATYDAVESASGILAESEGMSAGDARTALVPLNYMTFKSQLHVILNADGGVINIEKDKKPVTVLAPCTEESKGRTSKVVANPLFDKLMYVDLNVEEEKTHCYLEQLNDWKGNNAKLNAVFQYVSHHSIWEDSERFGIKLEPCHADGKLSADANIGVRFSVILPDDMCPDLQDDADIRQQWQEYVRDRIGHGFVQKGYDEMGKPLFLRARNYPKKILATAGNAKLISSNDADGFTFRGRFANKDEALCVDLMSSEKAHAVLQWLIANNAKIQDTQAIVVWRVAPNVTELVSPFQDSFDIGLSVMDDEKTNADILREAEFASGRDYAQMFSKLLRGYGKPEGMKQHESRVVIAIFDSAVPGRLSVTYYKELDRHDYIESILQWHVDSSWTLAKYIDGAVVPFIGAPSVRDIIDASYSASDRTSEGYKKYTRYVEKQLVECMFNNNAMPSSILWNGYHKVTRPMAYDKAGTWFHHLDVVCGLWRKHYIDEWRRSNRTDKRQRDKPEQSGKGMISMKLEPERTDRDYLYGRLLALADAFEGKVLRSEKITDRPTNAMKLMSNFSAKPNTTWGTLVHQLTPYFKPEFGYYWFQNEVDEVMSMFQPGDYESNKPLTPLYLLGYSAQRHESMERARLAKEAKKTQQ